MWFRLESHVRLPMAEGDTLQLHIGGDHDISVHFLKEFYDVGEPGYEVAYLNVTAQGGWELDSNAEMFFQYLANDELPPDERPPSYWVKAERQNLGEIKTSRYLGKMPGPGFVPPLNILPVSIQSMISIVRNELAEGTRHAVNLVQWRFGILGLHEPLQSSLLKWSLNGEQWKLAPLPEYWGEWITTYPEASFSEPIQNGLQSWIQTGQGEPLGRSLLREAWEHRERSRVAPSSSALQQQRWGSSSSPQR